MRNRVSTTRFAENCYVFQRVSSIFLQCTLSAGAGAGEFSITKKIHKILHTYYQIPLLFRGRFILFSLLGSTLGRVQDSLCLFREGLSGTELANVQYIISHEPYKIHYFTSITDIVIDCRLATPKKHIKLYKTNIAPEKRPSQKDCLAFQLSIFRWYVSFREGATQGKQ